MFYLRLVDIYYHFFLNLKQLFHSTKMKIFKKIDFLFFGYVFITTLFILLSWNEHLIGIKLLITRGVILFIILTLILLNQYVKNSIINFIRNIYPILISGYFYTETVFYNSFIWKNIDQSLINIDELIFNCQPSLEFSNLISTPYFGELMYFGYFSFYLLIISFVSIAYFKLKSDTSALIFKLSAAMLLFYLIFGIIPSAGPQFFLPPPQSDLPTGFIFEKIMHFIQENAEQPTAAFPSSHVGISIIILLLLREKANLFVKVALPFVIILVLSTVYIKAHYAIDVIGGIIAAPIILYLSSALYRFSFTKKNNF